MRKFLLVFFGIILFINSRAQVFTSLPANTGTIPDNGTSPTCFPITVTGVGNINTTTLGLASVKINVAHNFDDDLIISLVAPDGTTVVLSQENGNSGDNYTNTIFNGTTGTQIYNATAPFTGTFLPEEGLGIVNNGQNADGVWTLCIQDNTQGTTGKLNNWELTFNNTPAQTPPVRPLCNSSSNKATDSCYNAPTVCDFRGLCGSTLASYKSDRAWTALNTAATSTAAGGCIGSIDNSSFIQFIAGAPTATFNLWITSSADGLGIQTLFFEANQCQGNKVIGHGCSQIDPLKSTSSNATPTIITGTGLVPGKSYYLMFDGVAGDECNFVLTPNSGVSYFRIGVNPSTQNVCKGTVVTLSGSSTDPLATFSWSAPITPDGLSSTTGTPVTVNTAVLPFGPTVYTCTGTSSSVIGCPNQLTTTINVVDSILIKTVPLPAAQNAWVGYPTVPLTVICNVPGVTYNWYVNTVNQNFGGTLVKPTIDNGANTNTFTPSSDLPPGTYYYYCLVDNAGCAVSSSTIASVTLALPPPCNFPDSIQFLKQPTDVAQGYFMTPSVKVRKFCSSSGINDTTATGTVTLTASDGVCGYVTQTKPFIKGIATFDSIKFTRSPQNNVFFIATSSGFPTINSVIFNVLPPPATPLQVTLKNETFDPTNSATLQWPYTVDTTLLGGETNKRNDISIVYFKGGNYYFAKSFKANSGPGGKGTQDTITFQNLTGLGSTKKMKLSFKVASLDKNGGTSGTGPPGGDGVDVGEDLIVQTSVDNGATWDPLLTHQGGNDKLFPFSNTPLTTLTYTKNLVLSSSNKTSSAFEVDIPNGIRQFTFRVIVSNNRTTEFWCIDDVKYEGIQLRTGLPDSLPTVTAVKDTSICANFNVQLDAVVASGKVPVKYAWTPSSGFTLATDTIKKSPFTAVLNADQTYSVSIVDKDNCKATSNVITVKVITQPITYTLLAPAKSVCLNVKFDSLKTNALNTQSYQWYENTTASATGGTLITGATLPNYLPPSTTVGVKYYYCVLKSNCAPTVTTTVSGAMEVYAVPTITITGNNSICSGDSTTLTANGGDTYVWTSGPSTNTYKVGPTTNTTYEVTGTTTASGCSNKATISVSVSGPVAAPSITVVQPTCTVATGSVAITSSTTGLQFSIDGGATYIGTTTFNNLAAGPFSIIAKNASGCLSTPTTGSIIAPAGGLNLKLITSKADSCIGTILYLTGASTASNIVWYQNGLPISNINSVPPTKGVTVATIGGYTAFGYMGVAVDSKGNVYTSDFINNVVTKWAPGASIRDTAAGGNGQGFALNQLYNPSGLFIDENDTLYIADRNNSRVIKFPPNSTASTLGTIVAGGSGNGSTPDRLKDPTGVYVDNAGNVFVADASNNRIQKWSRGATSGVTVAGGNTAGNLPNQFNTPSSVSFDKSGNMYVSDILNNRIQKFTPPFSSSSVGQTLPISGLGFPSGIFIDINDSLFIADRYRQRILKYSIAKGTTSLVCGVPLVSGNSADRFDNPLSVWVREGAIYVADYFNSRVQKWAPSIDTFYTPTVSTSYYAEATNTSGCTTSSNTITVNSPVTPSISITPSLTGIICTGTSVTFTATISNGGNTPSYQWQLNGANIPSATASTYTLTNPNDNDKITCNLTSSYTCVVSPSASSNTITLTVNSIPVVPTITGNLTVCPSFTTQLSNTLTGGTWTSSDASIATVDANGLVKGISSGTATITYTVTNTCGTDSKSVTVSVSGSAPVVPAITGSNAALCPVDTKQLSNSSIGGTWSSDATAIATVNTSGLVTAFAEGTAIISYSITNSCGTSSQSFPITVNPAIPVVAAITGTATVCPTSTTQLANTTTGGTWSSNAISIATVTGGLVSGIATGTATITYTVTNSCGNDSKSIVITVNPAAPVVPAITGSSTAMCPNDTKQLANTLTIGTWSSDVLSVATVDVNGLVTAIAQGTASITYTVTNSCGADSKTFGITVNAGPPVVDVITGNSTICPATTTQLADLTLGGTWSSNATSIAKVDAAGLVTGIKSGTATITYTVTNSCGTDSKSIVITVSPAAPVVPAITGSTVAMCTNATKQLFNTLAGGTWTTNAASVAVVSTSGLVSAVSQGTATITYSVTNSCGTDFKTFGITVNAGPPVVDVITGNSTICPGATTQLANAIIGGTWTTNTISVATVGSTTGLVTGVKTGTAIITYTVTNSCGSDNKSIIITVSPAVPSVPAITGNTTICPTKTTTLRNTLVGGNWTSSDVNIATVDLTTGLVTGNSQGSATITYTVTNSCGVDSKSTIVTVSPPAPTVPAITGITTICPTTTTTQLSNTLTGGAWTSSNSNILLVSTLGLVTGKTTGSASIIYTVTNSCGSNSNNVLVTVDPAAPKLPAITGSNKVCPNKTISLNNALVGGVWSSNDLTVATISLNTGVVTGVSQGTAIITYTVTNSCGVDSKQFTITVNAPIPIVPAISGSSNLCPNTTAQLTNTLTGGVWKSSNSGIASVGSSSGLVTALSSGLTTISYIVTNSCGADTSKLSLTVIQPLQTFIRIKADTNTICSGGSVTFKVDSSSNGGSPQYQWTKNNVFVAGATSDTYIANSLNNGDVINCLFTSTLACVTGSNVFSNNIKITVKPNLTPFISIKTKSGQSSVDTICKGGPIEFNASTLNGGINPLFQWKVNGFDTLGNATNGKLVLTSLSNNDTVSCVLKSSEACLASNYPISNLIKVVVVDRPFVADIVGGGIVCYNGTLQLSNPTPNGTWSSSNINFATISNSGLVEGAIVGNTTISYTVSNPVNKCPSAAKTKIIAVEGLPYIEPIMASATSICKGDSILLSNNVSKGYWKSSDTNIAKVDSAKGWVLGIKPGYDTIKYIVKGFCGPSEVIKSIYVSGKSPISKAATTVTQPTCLYPLTGSVRVSVNGYSNESPYQFTFNRNTYSAPNTISNLGVNLYPIIIYNNIGCIVDSIPDFVLPYKSNANCDTLYVPSGFIPSNNAGNKNHTLKPFGGGYLQSVSFKVFNRLGNLVFESHDINSGWDGTMNGKLQDAGTYIWFLEYKQANGVLRQSKGVSVLIK